MRDVMRVSLVLLIGLVLLAAGPGLLSHPSSHAALRADNPGGVVAFVGVDLAVDPDGESAFVFLADLASGQVGQVDVPVAPDADLDWQPEGDMLAFTTAEGGYAVLDGLAGCFGVSGCDDVSVFTPDETVSGVEWSPDGAWLLVHTETAIKLVAPLAASLDFAWDVAITCGLGFEVSAPESFMLCAGADADSGGATNVYQLGPPQNGAIQPELLHELGAFPEQTTRAIGPNGEASVGTLEPIGDSAHVLAEDGTVQRIAPVQVHAYTLAFAPDGAVLIAVGALADSTGDGTLRDGDAAELLRYDMDSGQMEQIVGFSGATGAVWAGEGTLVIVLEHSTFMAYAPADDSTLPLTVLVPTDVEVHGLAWNPTGSGAGGTGLLPLATATPRAPATPIPTLTPFVINTPLPTLTPFVAPATWTPYPTITPIPSATPGSPLGVGCQYSYVGGGGLPVAIGDTAQVTNYGAGLRLRQWASLNATLIRELARGTRMTVLAGPQCMDGYRWWQVQVVGSGATGWVADSNLTGLWIEKASAIPPTPSGPSISFTASRSTITPGECVDISWDVSGIKEVYYLGAGIVEQGVIGTGMRNECPAGTTEYRLKVVKLDNSTQMYSVTVEVVPPSVSFTADHTFFAFGNCTVVRWNIVGYDHNEFNYSGAAGDFPVGAANGSVNECPSAGTHTFVLRRHLSGGGIETWTVTVNVFIPI